MPEVMRCPPFALLALTLSLTLVACPRSNFTTSERQSVDVPPITAQAAAGVASERDQTESKKVVTSVPATPEPTVNRNTTVAPKASNVLGMAAQTAQKEEGKAGAQRAAKLPNARPARAASAPKARVSQAPAPPAPPPASPPQQPTAPRSVPVEPLALKPVAVNSTAVKPTVVKAVPDQPTPAPPVKRQPGPARPVQRKPIEAQPAPARPTPTATPPIASVPARRASQPVTPAPPKPAASRPVIQPELKQAPMPAVAEPKQVAGPLQNGPAIRGLWVDAFGPGFKTSGEVDHLIADARAMNINTLFVQVVKRGDCYCNTSLLPRTEDPAVPADFDPLADVLMKAHAQGMKVHAWVIPTAVASRAVHYPVINPEHVINAHGEGAEQDWLMRNAAGAVWAGNDQQLDIGNPEARSFVVDALRSVAASYEVDGVQLDRVRYPDPSGAVQDWGYNPGAVAAYQAESGTTGTPAPGDARWTAWRRERVNALVSEVSTAVRSVRPGAVMSVAAITYGAGPGTREAFTRTRTYAEVLQDWPSWLASGQLDLVVMMNYKREASASQAHDFDTWNRFAKSVRAGGQVAAGAALYLNTAQENLAQARRVVGLGLDGWVGYSYRTPELGVEEGRKAGDQAYRELSGLLVGESGAQR